MSATAGNPNPFGTRMAIGLSIVGALLMFGLLIMSGFGQEIEQRTTRIPGPTAKGATGFQALHDMLGRLPGTTVTLARSDADLDSDVLLIATPDRSIKPKDVGELIRRRDFRPTLIILPKWETERDGLSSTRERRIPGGFSYYAANQLLTDVAEIQVTGDFTKVRRPVTADGTLLAPLEQPQTMMGKMLHTLISVRGQGAVLAQVGDTQTYVLSDPDIANNYGMRDPRNARAIVAAIEEMNDGQLDAVAFDLTLHYRPGDRNLIKLMFTPPFIAVTIALIAAAVLAGWASIARFGPVRREARALAFGKAALLDNIAMLTRSAGKASAGGPRYADMLAERLGARLHAPPRLKGAELTDWLDTRRPGWRARHDAVTAARDEGELVAAAQALDEFTKEKA